MGHMINITIWLILLTPELSFVWMVSKSETFFSVSGLTPKKVLSDFCSLYIFVTIHKKLNKYEFSLLFEFFSFNKAKIKRESAMYKFTFVRSEGQYTNSVYSSFCPQGENNKYTFLLMFISISFSNITWNFISFENTVF